MCHFDFISLNQLYLLLFLAQLFICNIHFITCTYTLRYLNLPSQNDYESTETSIQKVNKSNIHWITIIYWFWIWNIKIVVQACLFHSLSSHFGSLLRVNKRGSLPKVPSPQCHQMSTICAAKGKKDALLYLRFIFTFYLLTVIHA